jgi:CRISPR/Cas system-associated protein endoribonuclease Cas2
MQRSPPATTDMIDIFRIPISKEQFRHIPTEERGLVFVAGHILNQISVFMKLVRDLLPVRLTPA